jgi:hypothetical protein
MRPIELLTADIAINIEGTPTNLTAGVYANVISLAHAVAYAIEIATGGAGFVVRFTDPDFLCQFVTPSIPTNKTITWTTSFLPSVLGFGDNLGDSFTTITADVRPSHMWIPDFQYSDQSRWAPRHRRNFAGQTAKDGQLAGVQTGPIIRERTFSFPHEGADNLGHDGIILSEHAGETDSPSWEDSTYIYAEHRTLHHFHEKARSSTPTVASNASTRGVWYVEDMSNYTDTTITAALGNFASAGGVMFDLDSGADTEVWSMLQPKGPRSPSISVPSGKDYYNHSLTLNTCTTVPTWAYNPS